MPKAFVGFELLHDQVVVLAGFDESAVLADFAAALLIRRLDLRLAGGVHDELDEGVAGAGGRRRAENLDLRGGQRGVDVGPVDVGVGDDLAVDRDVLGKRLEDLVLGQVDRGAGLGVGEHDAVEADLDLDRGDAGGLAGLELLRLHGARGVGEVGGVLADAGAEQLHAAARARRFDDRGLELAALAELLGDGGGERKHGRRADDLDLVARGGDAGRAGEGDGRSRRREEEFLHLAYSCAEVLEHPTGHPRKALKCPCYSSMTDLCRAD